MNIRLPKPLLLLFSFTAAFAINFMMGDPSGAVAELANDPVSPIFLPIIHTPPKVITVTNANDAGPGSLRQAIAEASPGTIIEIVASGRIDLHGGRLFVNKALTIKGPGRDALIISGKDTDRVFDIYTSGTVAISDLSVVEGAANEGGGIRTRNSLDLHNVLIHNNRSVTGGGIYSYGGEVTMVNSIVSDNEADRGGGVFTDHPLLATNSQFLGNMAKQGGAIFSSKIIMIDGTMVGDNKARVGGGIYFSGMLTVTNSTLSKNGSDEYDSKGGAIYAANGGAYIQASTFVSNYSSSSGGALYVYNDNSGGTLQIIDVQFNDNTSGSGGAIAMQYGGIAIDGSRFANNLATGSGGAIYNNRNMAIVDSIFLNNVAGGSGGAINTSRILHLRTSVLMRNVAGGNGGGISGSGYQIEDSAIHANQAGLFGGGVDGQGSIYRSAVVGNSTGGSGGGISNQSNYGKIVLADSTVAQNNANNGQGGGIYNTASLVITNTTVVENSAITGGGLFDTDGSTRIMQSVNSIFANNAASFAAEIGGGILESLGYNLVEDTSGAYIAGDQNGNIYGVDPMLSPQTDANGVVWIYLPENNSPVIDAGKSAACSTADQRGWTRPIDGNGDEIIRCDIGAIEYYP